MGVFTGGGACEIFGEEFSHFFMTNFFDLHPQKKPKIFPPAAEKIIGGGRPPNPPEKNKPYPSPPANKKKQIRFKGYINNQEVISQEFKIGKDCCHIYIISGAVALSL
mgnify:CR=1 FL=1